MKKITKKPMRLNLQRFDDGGEAPATVEAITEALTGLEGGAAYVAGLNQLIASDKKGKSDIAKLNARVAKLTGSEKTLTTERDAAIQKFNRLLDFNGIPADTYTVPKDVDTQKEGMG